LARLPHQPSSRIMNLIALELPMPSRVDYSHVLRARARQAQPRSEGVILDYLLNANARCLAAWRRRWAERRPLPDAYSARDRAQLTLIYLSKRWGARLWMATRQ
jgi:hypothetical protein